MQIRCWKCGKLFERDKLEEQTGLEIKKDDTVSVCPECKTLNRF